MNGWLINRCRWSALKFAMKNGRCGSLGRTSWGIQEQWSQSMSEFYPSVNVYVTMEKHNLSKWVYTINEPFAIAMLNYQGVDLFIEALQVDQHYEIRRNSNLFWWSCYNFSKLGVVIWSIMGPIAIAMTAAFFCFILQCGGRTLWHHGIWKVREVSGVALLVQRNPLVAFTSGVCGNVPFYHLCIVGCW